MNDKKELKTFTEVGQSAGLSGERLLLYVKYMETRWKDEEETQCLTGYAKEWAHRFLDNREYECSDGIGRSILDDLYKV